MGSTTTSRPASPCADDNIVVQVVGFVILCICMAIIVVQFIVLGQSAANATVVEPVISPVAEAAAYIPAFETVSVCLCSPQASGACTRGCGPTRNGIVPPLPPMPPIPPIDRETMPALTLPLVVTELPE